MTTDKKKISNRSHKLKTRYGMTQNDVDKLLIKQNCECAICKRFLENFVVDHDYSTGCVRGLLCRNCNSGLGMFKDSINNFIRAIAYIGYSPYATNFIAKDSEKRENINKEYFQVFN